MSNDDSKKELQNAWNLIVALAVLLGTSATAKATSIIFPKFSAPILVKDRLIFTSPDAKRLLCISLDGKKLWEKSYALPVHLFTRADGEPLLQSGRVINDVFSESGDLRSRFSVEDENDLVSYSKMLGAFVSSDRRLQKRTFKLLDVQTGKPLWTSREIDDVICATPQLLVCLAAQRIPSFAGYRIGKASLNAFDRGTFQKKWSVPLRDQSGVPFLPSGFKAPYLIYTDGGASLAVLDCTTGRKVITKEMQLSKNGWISDIEIHDNQVVWLASGIGMNRANFNDSEHTLHFCSIPELTEQRTVVLKLIEIAHVSFEGGFIISDALYRTACFRTEGEKIWERFQCERTQVINNRIYFSDYTNNTARLGVVEVPTGQESILYREEIKKQQ